MKSKSEKEVHKQTNKDNSNQELPQSYQLLTKPDLIKKVEENSQKISKTETDLKDF